MTKGERAYETLGVIAGATPLEVKRAYRNLVRRWHPDRFANDPVRHHQALEMLKSINDAYEQVLADIEDRQHTPEAPLWTYTAPAVVPPHDAAISTPPVFESPAFSSSHPFVAAVRQSFTSGKNLLFAAVVIAGISAGVVTIDYIASRNELHEAMTYDGPLTTDSAGEVRIYGGSLPQGRVEPFPGRASRAQLGPTSPRSPYVESPFVPVVPETPVAPAAPIAAPARKN